MPKIYVVDAFTDEAFKGNPAAVVLLTEPMSDAWMLSVAAEMKHSETAFVDVSNPAAETQSLRWFTPEVEVDLCGHATLATTHVLGGSRRYSTLSGELRCVKADDGWIDLDFPLDNPTVVDVDLGEELGGLEVTETLRGRSDVLVAVSTEAEVRAFVPDFEAISKIDARGVILTAAADETDFVARFFGPRVGIPEDPVTGSAHTTLAAYWGKRLGKTEMISRQVSHRPGTVAMHVKADRVILKGQAATVLKGELFGW